jgi:hypothetical protein
MTDLALLTKQAVSLSPNAPVEEVADLLGRLEVAGKAYREFKALCEERVLEYVSDHGPIDVGEIRYFAGTDKKTVCKDTRATAEAVLDATAGDLDAFCEQLGAQPWKYGALKTLLGQERWAQFFDVVEKVDLKTKKAEKKLLTINTRFLGERKSA